MKDIIQDYLVIGYKHIMDKTAYDHLLFIIALCAVYLPRNWRTVLFLVTAFTIGHSLTLALATFNILTIDTDLVEFLIPATILFTALLNVFRGDPRSSSGRFYLNYLLAGGFGLIHGLGFSTLLKMLLGREENIWLPLLSFNIGIELGQIIIVIVFLTVAFLCVELFQVQRRDWRIFVSSVVAGMAFILLVEAWYW